MADEPDNRILQLLREISGTLGDHTEKVAVIDRRFGHIDTRLEEIHETLFTVAGATVHANVRPDTVAERLKALDERVGRLEEKA